MWYSMEEAAVNRGTGCGSGIRRHGECMRTPKMQMKSKRGDFMVIRQHMQFLSNDSITLVHAVKWVPEGEVKAVLQISHGMCEFVERYDEFAVFLAERGVLVVGNDHLGHGESIRSKEEYGYFAEENGNSTLIKDLHRLRKMGRRIIRTRHISCWGIVWGRSWRGSISAAMGKGWPGRLSWEPGTIRGT